MEIKATIRQATEKDADAVARLWLAAFEDQFVHAFGPDAGIIVQEWLHRDPSIFTPLILAVLNEHPVGFLQLEYKQKTPQTFWRMLMKDLRHLPPLLQLTWKHLGPFRMFPAMLKMLLIDLQPYKPYEMYVKMIGVDEAYRGMGIGSQLLEYADTMAKEHECTHLALEVLGSNTDAIRLYERHEYACGRLELTRQFRFVSGKTCGIYRMVKSLEKTTG